MKCNELTSPIKIEIPGLGTIESNDLLLKSEVVAVIDKLKAENERLTIDKRNAELRADVADATVEKLKANNEDIDYQRKQLSRLCAIKENEIKELIDKIQDLKVIVSQKEDAINKLVDKAFNIKKERNSAQRAMWLMTAEWADAMGLASCNIANKFMSRENFEVGDDYRNKTIKKYMHRQVVFYKYADYCRNKAKEYK